MADIERITPGHPVWRRRPGEEEPGKRHDGGDEPAAEEREERSDEAEKPDSADDDGHVDIYV